MKDLLIDLTGKQDSLLLSIKFKELMDDLEKNYFQEAYFLVGIAQEVYWKSVFRKSQENKKTAS